MRRAWSGLVWSGVVVVCAAARAEEPSDELALDPSVEARAYGGALDASYDHALLEPSARALVATGGRTTAEWIHDLHRFNRIQADAEGTVTWSKGAELVEVEPAEGWEPTDRPAPPALPLVAPTLRALLEEGGSSEVLDLVLSLDQLAWNPIVSVEHERLAAMIEGRIETRRDALLVRHEAVTARTEAGARALAPLLDALDGLGMEVVRQSPVTGSVRVRAPAHRLPELVALPGLAHVDPAPVDVPAAGYPNGWEVTGTTLTGMEVMNLLQTTQFYDDGYFGSSDGYIGLEEGNATNGGSLVRRSHPGFDDAFGADRWTNCGSPSGTTCGTNPNPDPGNEHATKVASVLLGDVTLGQDSVPTPLADRSGVARRAHGLGTGADSDEVVAIMTYAPRDIHLLSQSAGNIEVPCTGTSSYSQDWNAMFESDVAIFSAAGNEEHDTSTCTVRDPAMALGSFAVGAFGVDSGDDEATTDLQSRGGGVYLDDPFYLPDGRTIVDVQGATDHEYAYQWDGAETDQYPGEMGNTSGATPTVSGSAALFRDWYLDQVGTDIDAPGLMYANLLLMGDRIAEGGGYLDTGFDELTGAGRLRMRKYDNLDAPYGWGDGSFCVDDGMVHTINVAPGGLDADVDMVKAVIWWYDHRHDAGTLHDKLKLTLQRYDEGLEAWVIVRTDDSDDHKQRVYQANPTTDAYRLRVTGVDVTSDVEGCGTDSTLIYYAWMYEDQDRDTNTDLDDQVRPEE